MKHDKKSGPPPAIEQWLQEQLAAKPDDRVLRVLNHRGDMQEFWQAVADFPDAAVIEILEGVIVFTREDRDYIRFFADHKFRKEQTALLRKEADAIDHAAAVIAGLQYQEFRGYEEFRNDRREQLVAQLAAMTGRMRKRAQEIDEANASLPVHSARGGGIPERSAFFFLCDALLNGVSIGHHPFADRPPREPLTINKNKRNVIIATLCGVVLGYDTTVASLAMHRSRRSPRATD